MPERLTRASQTPVPAVKNNSLQKLGKFAPAGRL
jgi:hypothetical protein